MSAQVTLRLLLAASVGLAFALPAPIEGRASFRSGPSLQQYAAYRQKPSYYQNPSYQQNTAYPQDQQDSSYEETEAYQIRPSNPARITTQLRPTFQQPSQSFQTRPTFQQPSQSFQIRPSFQQPIQASQARSSFQPTQPSQSQPTFQSRPTFQPRYFDTIPNYNYDYGVQDQFSGASYGANEDRNGDSTRGSYYVDLPDGRRQMVNYRVDGDSGFVAEISYEGEALFPATSTSSNSFRPAYQSNRG